MVRGGSGGRVVLGPRPGRSPSGAADRAGSGSRPCRRLHGHWRRLEEPQASRERHGRNADDAFGFVRGTGIVVGLTQDLDDTTKAGALDELRATIEAHDTGRGVLFGTSAWLITATRT